MSKSSIDPVSIMRGSSLEKMANTETIPQGLEIFLLGTSTEPCGFNNTFPKSQEVWNKLRVMQRLEGICREYALPVRFAHETLRIMMKKNRYWYSYKKQIMVLLSVLNHDENYIFFHKMRAIKARYEGVTGI